MLIPIDSVKGEEERIREDYGKEYEWRQFLASFPKYGQIQPIRVENDGNGGYLLISGGRRLRAIRTLHEKETQIPGIPKGYIEASLREPVPLHTKLLMEFAENNDRKDFSWIERAKFIRKFHEMMCLEKGADVWTQELTAASLNISPASISHYLRVEEAAKTSEAVAKAETLDAAVKRMKVNERITKRIQEIKQDDNSCIQRASNILYLNDARDQVKELQSESIDLINFDPPWGDNSSSKPAENHESFDDSTEYAQRLMDDLFPELFRILRPDRYCIFWHRSWASQAMADYACSFGFNLQFTRTPCIWFKPDKDNDQNRYPEKQLIEAYEMFYLLRKGDPIFYERMTNNVFVHERVAKSAVIHPTEKPLDLCNALLRLCTVPGEQVYDPCAGSSSFLDAALRANRKPRGCEKSPHYHERGIERLASYLKTFSEK